MNEFNAVEFAPVSMDELNQIVKDIHHSQGTISKLIYDDQLYNDVRRPIQRLARDFGILVRAVELEAVRSPEISRGLRHIGRIGPHRVFSRVL